MLAVLPLALASAVFPTFLAAVVVILGLPSPGRVLLVYLAGALLMSVAAGLAWVYVFSEGWALDASDPTVSASGDVAAVVGYTLVKFAFAEVPLAGYFLAPRRTRDVVERLNIATAV